MSLSGLLAFADAHGIDYSRPAEIPPARLRRRSQTPSRS